MTNQLNEYSHNPSPLRQTIATTMNDDSNDLLRFKKHRIIKNLKSQKKQLLYDLLSKKGATYRGRATTFLGGKTL